jgi:hypothetical protein
MRPCGLHEPDEPAVSKIFGRLHRYVRVERPEDVPPPDPRIVDVVLLDMNHGWPNLGHDSLVHSLLEGDPQRFREERRSGVFVRVVSYDVRRRCMIPEPPAGGRFAIYLGTGGPGHIDPHRNDGETPGSQGLREDPSWEAPLFRLFEAIQSEGGAALLAVCHSFGVICRWLGVARPVLRGPEKGGKSSGVLENALTAEAASHPWFGRFVEAAASLGSGGGGAGGDGSGDRGTGAGGGGRSGGKGSDERGTGAAGAAGAGGAGGTAVGGAHGAGAAVAIAHGAGSHGRLRILDNRLFDLIEEPRPLPAGALRIGYETLGVGGPPGDALTMLELARDAAGVMPRVFAVNHHPEVVERRHQLELLEKKLRRGEVSVQWVEERREILTRTYPDEDSDSRLRRTSEATLLGPLRFFLYRQLRRRAAALRLPLDLHEDQVLRQATPTA